MFREWVGHANAKGENDCILQHPLGGTNPLAYSLGKYIHKTSP